MTTLHHSDFHTSWNDHPTTDSPTAMSYPSADKGVSRVEVDKNMSHLTLNDSYSSTMSEQPEAKNSNSGSDRPPLDDMYYPKTNYSRQVVVDSGAFFRLKQLHNCGQFFYITPGIAQEIKDAQSRQHLRLLSEIPHVKIPTHSDKKEIINFAKATGDYSHLSSNDIELMALAYMLQRESGDMTKIKSSPLTPNLKCSEVPYDWGVLKQHQIFDGNVSGKTTPSSTSDQLSGPTMDTNDSTTVQSDDGAEGEDEVTKRVTDSDGEGEWITAENFNRIGVDIAPNSKSDQVEVACMTTDYSIQNVLAQMGIPVMTLDGYFIKTVKLWGLICRSCYHFSRDTTKLFCGKCGNATVDRVPITVDSVSCEVTIHDSRKKRNLRGSIYSIPKTKGGRNSKDLILTEDQFMMGGKDRLHRHQVNMWEKERSMRDPFNLDFAYEQQGWWNRNHLPSGKIAVKGMPKKSVGYGRGNPNSNRFHKRKS